MTEDLKKRAFWVKYMTHGKQGGKVFRQAMDMVALAVNEGATRITVEIVDCERIAELEGVISKLLNDGLIRGLFSVKDNPVHPDSTMQKFLDLKAALEGKS